MATLPSSTLPHVDLTKALEPGTPQWEVTCQTIREALETYGCFAVEYDGITCEEREEIFAEMGSLFDLPTETKKKVKSLPHSTLKLPELNPGFPETPLRQLIGLHGLQMPETALALTDLMWPHGNPNFCQTINSMSKKMTGLAIALAKMVLHSYGLDKYCDSQLEDVEDYLVMLKYSAPMTDKPTLGVGEHVDLSFITILFQNCVDGLLTKSRNGNWLQVIPGKFTFVVMAGLTLKVWSNGRVHVPRHKVDIKGSNDRLSCILFLGAPPKYKDDQLIIEVPHELVDEHHPPLFKPFKMDEFRKYYAASGFAEDSLDKYAGI